MNAGSYTIRLGGLDWQLEPLPAAEADKEGVLGWTSPRACSIKVRDDLSGPVWASVVIHELIHAMIAGNPLTRELEEMFVLLLETLIVAFFRDNPAFVRILIKKLAS